MSKNKILLIFFNKNAVIVTVFMILILLIFIQFEALPKKHTEDVYTPDKQYFEVTDLSEGLWGYGATNYTNNVFEAIENKKISRITVAILDTGIDLNHPDLKEHTITGYNFVDNSESTFDDHGHGTQIAGIIGGKYTGVANGVKLMPVKVLNKEGFGKTEDFVKGILWAVDNGADIINLSLGRQQDPFRLGDFGNSFNELEYQAIQYALLHNVIVVSVAGDFNEGSLSYPAAYNYPEELKDRFIIVSGINSEKNKALMSNYSLDIDVAAPGEYVLTTHPFELDKEDNDYANIPNDGYILTNGTSYAAAHVSGLVAIIKSLNPNTNVKNKIVQNTQDIGSLGKDEQFGYGLIDFHKTVTTVQ